MVAIEKNPTVQNTNKTITEDVASTGRGVVRASCNPQEKKKKTQKFLLKSLDAFPQKIVPAKISHYTFVCLHTVHVLHKIV